MRAALFLLCALLRAGIAEILQVQIVHRHGARTHLRKDVTLHGVETDAALLPAGVKELRVLGSLIRTEYLLGNAKSHLVNAHSKKITADDVLSVSSKLNRTLASARAFLTGLYPKTHELIRTTTYGDKDEDYRLRGYAICPKYAERVSAFLSSPKFQLRANAAALFLADVAHRIGDVGTLQNVFNIYDFYKVASLNKTTDVQPLSEEYRKKLSALADWVESQKLSGAVAKTAPGAPLVATLLKHSRAVERGDDDAYRIVEYSAHYPTILTLVAALAPDRKPQAPFDGLPPFGAALLWETSRENNVPMLRTRWYDGTGGTLKTVRVLPCAAPTEDGACRLDEVEKALSVSEIPETFCKKCGIDVRGSSVCKTGGRQGMQMNASTCRAAVTKWGFIGVAVGAAATLLAAMVMSFACAKRRIRLADRAAREVRVATAIPTEDDPGWSGRQDKFSVCALGVSPQSSGASSGLPGPSP